MIYLKAKEVFGFNNNNSRYNTTSIYKLIAEITLFQADVVVGGFPCQSFSHSGKRRGFEDDKGHDLKEAVNANGENSRGSLYKSFVEVVRRVKPKMFVAENVYGLMTMPGEPIKQIMQDFRRLGMTLGIRLCIVPLGYLKHEDVL
jgi:DNA (cytosine-5)-methyltransferase 1